MTPEEKAAACESVARDAILALNTMLTVASGQIANEAWTSFAEQRRELLRRLFSIKDQL